MPKNNKAALWALAAAGGMWAWRNRDKIQGMINKQMGQSSRQPESRFPSQSQPMTGETHRINLPDQPEYSQPSRLDPSI